MNADIFANYNENHEHREKQKIVLVSEKQLFEGVVSGFGVAMSSILLFRSGLTTKAFKRVSYDWLEFKVILAITLCWIIVWCARKISNVLYDRYVAAYGRDKPIEISINTYNN